MPAAKPPAIASSRFRRRLRYWLLLTGLGAFCNALAVTVPGAVPFLLGNMGPVALAMRLPWPWAFSSALVVGAALGDPRWAALVLLQTAMVTSLRRRWHPLPLFLLVAGLALPALIWLARPLDGSVQQWALGTASGLVGWATVYYGARQVHAQSMATRSAELSLARQLASNITLAGAAPLCVLMMIALQVTWWVDLGERRMHLRQATERVSSAVGDYLAEHRRAIRYAAAVAEDGGPSPWLDRLQDSYPGFLTLLITDDQGVITGFHAPQASGFGGSVSDRHYFTEPRRTGEPFVSPVFRGRGFGTDLLVAVSAPYRRSDGAFAGIVEGSLALTTMQDEVARAAQSYGLEFAVVDGGGNVVVSSLRQLETLTPAEHPTLLAGDRPRGVPLNRAGSHLMHVGPVDELDWRVLLLDPLPPIVADATQNGLLLALLCLAAIALLSKQAERFAEPYAAPLRELVLRVREVELSQPSTLQPLDIPAVNAEYAELLDDFNLMLRRLRELNDDLWRSLDAQAALNRELEARVQARTAELSAAVDRAEQLARSKSVFLANMSHELRTPLTAILGFAEEALRDPQPQPQWTETLRTIVRNGRHLLGIVNDVLDAGRIDAGQMRVESVMLSPLRLVEDVAALFSARAGEQNLELRVDYRWPLPEYLFGDPLRLRQVLINLLGNAFKFTERGRIRILVEVNEADWLDIAVNDTGIGMNSEQQSRLFRPFEQADVSTTRRFGGSGLGLFVSGKLIEAMGGRILVESAVHSGSRFTVRLPVAPGTPLVHALPTRREVDEPNLTVPRLRGRVLITDDVADLRLLIEQLVRATGATTAQCSNGAEAVQCALAEPFDLLLMDMHMPVLDGRGATRQLRAAGYRGAIVALTADVLASDVESFLAAGCTAVLAKPVDRAQLFATLARHLPAAPSEVEMPPGTAAADAPGTSRVASPRRFPAQSFEEALAAIAQRFRSQLPGEVDAIEQALTANDREALLRRLHSLKGSAGTFGFAALSDLARQAETRVRSDDNDPATACGELLSAMREQALS